MTPGWADVPVGVSAPRRKRYSAKEFRELCERWDRRCAYCGLKRDLYLEHVVPLARGGDESPENVVPACRDCNLTKSNMLILEWICVRSGVWVRRGHTRATRRFVRTEDWDEQRAQRIEAPRGSDAARRLRERRVALGLSRDQLAREAGYAVGTIATFEAGFATKRGLRRVTETLDRLAGVSGLREGVA